MTSTNTWHTNQYIYIFHFNRKSSRPILRVLYFLPLKTIAIRFHVVISKIFDIKQSARVNSPSHRFSSSLRYIELPMELITHPVLHELASKCPNLTIMLLDFSTAMQLHDFNDMQVSPHNSKQHALLIRRL